LDTLGIHVSAPQLRDLTRRAVNDALTPARSAAFFAATACMFAASEALSRAAEAVRPALVLATLVRAASNFSPAHVFNAWAGD
jgi:hypothetical protein